MLYLVAGRNVFLFLFFKYPISLLLQEDDEEFGDLYQDEENGAALLIRRHPKHGKLVVVSFFLEIVL